jgi:hypothetical protein
MNTQDKDRSIVIQVAAKIAAELTPRNDNMDTLLGNYAVLFDGVKGILVDEIFGDQPVATNTQQNNDAVVERIMEAFPNSTMVQDAGFSIRVKGTQHGPLPEWLASACRAKGVTEVWDNRDKLSQNPKRPWFKSTTSDDAFWAPRGK